MNLLVSLFSTINFFVQPVLYHTPLTTMDSSGAETRIENIFYLEFNCAIPYNELFYREIGGKIIADCGVKLKIVNRRLADSLLDSLSYQFTIPSFSQAAKEQMVFYLQFGRYLTQGEYDWSVTVSCQDKYGKVQGRRAISELDYLMSDILLAQSITQDTTGGFLTKGNLRVVPNPSGIFESKAKNLFIYYELYNIKIAGDSLRVTYLITDSHKKTVRKITRYIAKKFSRQALNLGINIEALKPDSYQLTVMVDDSVNSRHLAKQVDFQIQEAKVQPLEITTEDLPYYEAIEYFVSPQEYKHFQGLDGEGKKLYLKKFWQKHNYQEIAQRYEYADAHFQEGYLAGSKTDRGRIYIKYGPPDEVDNKQFEEAKPYEYWQYYNGLEFIFVDVRGTQEYILVWTNAPDEKSKPGLYRYLPVFKRREIGEDKE
ncbi:MAG: GWxTD domain-containing protein [candidate division WOR-3 bacterium]